MYTLGISAYAHEASCALLKDGKLCAHAEEERFNRERHTAQFPANALRYCLEREGITLAEVESIAFFWTPFKELRDNLGHFLKYFPASIQLLRTGPEQSGLGALGRMWKMHSVGEELRRRFELPSVPKVHFVEHHLAHASSAFFCSPFEEAAILTIDGRGESASTVLSMGRGKKIEKLLEIKVPHSLGHLYAAITSQLGFRPFFDEWKVMGLSAYGSNRLLPEFEKLVRFDDEGIYFLNLDYFQFHTHGQSRWLSKKFEQNFGPAREKGEELTQHHFDIAYALQKTVEKAGVALAAHLQALTGSKNLCVAGGVALNCLMNSEIVRRSPFENFFFQPMANDAGTSYGAALHDYHQRREQPRSEVFKNIYQGPEFSDDQVETVLKKLGTKFRKSAEVEREAAAYIADGKIVGWFQGRMESGPRALGNRSILADPTRAEVREKLNSRVKHREWFRPFAPAVKEEGAHLYFTLPKSQLSPHMMLIADVTPSAKVRLPAITHVDGTARVQMVSQEANLRFWKLLDEFEKLKGIPVLLNTSFNENEPIVCNPEQAVACFLRTEFDVLAIGNFIVTKENA